MKFKETDRWCYGSTDELFTDDFPTKEDAIEYCRNECGGGYIGRIVEIEFDESDVYCDEIGYRLQEKLYDQIGDASEDWNLSTEQEKELSEILAKAVIEYINKNNLQPKCYKVVDIENVQAGEE